jgi:hypothetical protein
MLPVKPIFYEHSNEIKKPAKITAQRIKQIEQSDCLLTTEKVNLIAILLGFKQVTDIAIDRKADWGKAREVLGELGIANQPNEYVHENTKYEWLQAAVNNPVLQYVMDRRNELTVLEAGVLYGYPVSSCLAYVGLLEKAWFEKTLAEHWLSGVFSKSYTTLEREHFERMWTSIAEASPSVAANAKQEYEEERSWS